MENTKEAAPEVLKNSSEEDIIINAVDFEELLKLQNERDKCADNVNKIAGQIVRLKKDLEQLYNWEKTRSIESEQKRLDIAKRHKIDNSKQWFIDFNTRKVIYNKG